MFYRRLCKKACFPSTIALLIFLLLSACKNGNGTVTYADGSTYSGGFRYGLRNGTGMQTLPGGKKYFGQFRNGMRDGYGRLMFVDGKILYSGDWKGNAFAGFGITNIPEEFSFGQWLANSKNGYHYLESNDGTTYLGEMRLNQASGYGQRVTERTWYTGEHIGDKRNGFGTLVDSEGVRYVGHWKDGLREGKGAIIWPDGTTITGEWEKDTLISGMLADPSGVTAIGAFYNNKDGRFEIKEGAVFEGKTSLYIGELKQGLKHGRGTLFFSNGASYIGPWIFGNSAAD